MLLCSLKYILHVRLSINSIYLTIVPRKNFSCADKKIDDGCGNIQVYPKLLCNKRVYLQ